MAKNILFKSYGKFKPIFEQKLTKSGWSAKSVRDNPGFIVKSDCHKETYCDQSSNLIWNTVISHKQLTGIKKDSLLITKFKNSSQTLHFSFKKEWKGLIDILGIVIVHL